MFFLFTILTNSMVDTNDAIKNSSTSRQGTVQKKKPLPKIPLNKASMPNLTSLEEDTRQSIPPPLPAANNCNTYVSSVGTSWTEKTTSIGQQFIMMNNNEMIESPSTITNYNNYNQQQQKQSNDSYDQYQMDKIHQIQLPMDYNGYVDPYYAAYQHQTGYSIYGQPYNSGYYNHQQPYYNNCVNDITNDISTASISTTTTNNNNEAWKNTGRNNNGSINTTTATMIKRADSLKIEITPVPVPFSNSGQLPLATHLEKPFEPTSADEHQLSPLSQQQQPQQPQQPLPIQQQQQLYRKASKEEISSIIPLEQNSILLQKLFRHHTAVSISYDSSSSASGSCESLSTPHSSVSSSSSYHRKQKRHASMPFLNTTNEAEEDQSFSASEKYFNQPNNVSPISSRIPSPWGTATSSRSLVLRQRISTGSILNVMAVQTAVAPQVPDEIVAPAAVKSVSSTEGGIEQYFNAVEKGQLSIASCSLIHIKSNTKLYRRMAIKTKNMDTQMTYAKYLLQISKLYEKNTATAPLTSSTSTASLPITSSTSKNNQQKVETPAETRHRLLSEAGYWIERLAKANKPEALFIKGRWHLLGPQAQDCALHGYEKVQEPKAFKCFLQASKLGWTEAHYELAQLYKKRGNFKQAIQCFEKGVKEKHAPSIYVSRTLLLWVDRY
jgi:tetratricopeptide (TPR) repeat protein